MRKSLVLGFFDGVHKGHKSVIQSAFDYSDDVVVVTFKESPAIYFGFAKEYILSRKNSVKKIKDFGVNEILELDFSKIAKFKAEEYIKFLVEKFNPVSISIGYNHTFGFNKEGTPEFLDDLSKKYDFECICVPPVMFNQEVISSTLIRNCLKDGNIEKANTLLESSFILEGIVVHGEKIGRTIGFPTANINYSEELVKIPYGVYSVLVFLPNGERKKGIMNWGMKPTFSNIKLPVAEVHIVDYDGDLYGKNIMFEVVNQIRTEQKFNSIDELKMQIQKDIKACLKL